MLFVAFFIAIGLIEFRAGVKKSGHKLIGFRKNALLSR